MGHRGFIVDAARLRPCGWDRPPGLAFTEHVDFTQWSQQDRAELAGRAGETVLAPARIDAYFAHLAVLVNGSSVFNVLAHCDYPRRYWPSARAGAYAEADFEQEYRAVSRALASRGGGCGESAGLAARASSFRLLASLTRPNPDVVTRQRDAVSRGRNGGIEVEHLRSGSGVRWDYQQ